MTGFFCPKFKAKDPKTIYAGPPQYGGDGSVMIYGYYCCASCCHTFEIDAGYTLKLKRFNFVDNPYMDDDIIEVPEGGE